MKTKINFTIEDYNDYISKKISILDLCKKYGYNRNQIDYRFRLYMKQNNLPNKRDLVQENRDDTYFDKIDTPNKAYILGFYLADGCISNNRLTFTQINEDAEILEYIKNEIYPQSTIRDIKEHKNKKTGYISKPSKGLSMYSIHLCETLRKYFGDKKTYMEHTIKNIVPEQFIFDFIRGFFDGDGCISFSYITRKAKLKNGNIHIYHNINKQWFIVSYTKNILDELCDFLKDNDINTHVFQEKRHNTYLINTSSYPEIKKIYNKLYYDGCICLKRKKNKFEQLIYEMSK